MGTNGVTGEVGQEGREPALILQSLGGVEPVELFPSTAILDIWHFR
jgi:hypothetical protein